MERNIQKNGLMNLFLLLVVSLATFAVARFAQTLSGQVAVVFLGLGALVAAVSWFQARLEERERVEKLEFDEVSRTGASSTLFHAGQADAFPAQRAREQFEKFFVPAFTIVLTLLQCLAGWWIWRWLSSTPGPTLNQPLVAMAILGLFSLVLFVLGQFSTGLARLDKQRLLQPSASYVLFGAYLLALVLAALAGVQAGFPAADRFLALAFCILLGLLALENLLTLLLEIYRPRLKGTAVRLLYDSRFVGLISHPEGIFTTVAHTLDYQFGFKVSDTWFYQFLQRSIAWLVLFYFVILAASTCLIYLPPGEEALLERFGNPAPGRELIGPGFHAKLPWPMEKAYRYRTLDIQSFDIGFEHDDEPGAEHEDAPVLWTVSHYKEEFHLLVASREQAGATNSAGARRAPPVNLLSVGIPVQFQIHDLKAWAYNYTDAGSLLKEIATREVVRYLVGVDVNEIMSTARFTAGEELQRRIQNRSDELKLGVRILFVGLQDVHPPVAVGAAYEKFVGAKQKREANILKARAEAIRTNAQATAEVVKRKLQASAENIRRVSAAQASETLFTNQMAAYKASPEVYTQRAYLQNLARHGSGARKFILAVTNSQEVLFLNMEDKIRDDILNVPMPAPRAR